ncbi:MAG: hypothetical protein ACW99L_12065, partial [Promethearchaeota archaeon]
MFYDVIIFTFFWVPAICLIGYLFEVFLYRKNLGPFSWIINILTVVGVLIHEISHRIMCAITGVPAGNMRVRIRNRQTKEISVGGSVSLKHPFQMTFLQGLLVGLAPLLFGTWMIYFSLLVAFNSIFDPLYRIIAGLFCLSVLLALVPSSVDIAGLRYRYQNDPKHSWYQVFLLILSFAIAWVLVDYLVINLPFEFLYYFVIAFCYGLLKYTFLGINTVFAKLGARKNKHKRKRGYKRLVRRRFKPIIT